MRFASLVVLIFWSTVSSTQSITDSLIIEDELHINYASDKFDISKENKEHINLLIQKYKDPIYTFRLDAHTDSDGSDEYNITLSRKRCDGIKQVILDNQIPLDRINYFSHGEERPIAQETDQIQKSKNRRATIKVFKNTEFIAFNGSLTPDNSAEIITGDIYLQYDNHKSSISTDSSGAYRLKIPTNKKVELNILAKNHFPLRKELKLTKSSKTDKIKFELTKYSIDNSIRTTIQFKGNKSIILNKSLSELTYLGLSLKSNSDVCVELEGHVNRPNEKAVPRDHHDFGLSIARSVVVFNYLVEEGISRDRMLARGYGNSRMLYPKAGWEKERSANRRVEVKMMHCDSTKLLKNDSVPDMSIYNKEDPMSRIFNYNTQQKDMSGFPLRIQNELKAQIKFIESKQKNPEEFSYLQLLSMSRRRAKK